MIAEERRELRQHPEDELDELVQLNVEKGLNPTTARQVAEQLTAGNPVAAHLDAELHLVSPTTSSTQPQPPRRRPGPSLWVVRCPS